MKYSILLPSYDPQLKRHDMFMTMVKSIDLHSRGKDYELIIRKNGDYSYVEAVNECFKTARGDYLISCQDDMIIDDDGWLEKLADPECYCAPEMGKTIVNGVEIKCPYWPLNGMPRKIFEKVGMLDTRFKDGICYDDDDYMVRMHLLKIPIKVMEIRYKHIGAGTLDAYKLEEKKGMIEHNKKIFEEKWKDVIL